LIEGIEMSEAQAPANGPGPKRITELRVSGHLMTLDTGTFCVFHAPGSATGDGDLGLPGVRISLPPGPAHNPDEVAISTFRPDGWLGGSDAAALIRISSGPAQVLVTIYQAPGQPADTAPRLQVLRLAGEASPAQFGLQREGNDLPGKQEVLAHIQVAGDVAGKLGEWMGVRGSKNWIEGFSIVPPLPLKPEDIEYQAVLGRGWMSPWVKGGQFCGSRGMALPLLGIRVRLKGDLAEQYDCLCSASFVDGAEIGPLPAGGACEADTLAPLEAFQITLIHNEVSAAGPTKKPANKFSAQKPVSVKTAPAKVVAAIAKPVAKPRPMQRPPGRPAR
jgi:hypothetical protein